MSPRSTQLVRAGLRGTERAEAIGCVQWPHLFVGASIEPSHSRIQQRHVQVLAEVQQLMGHLGSHIGAHAQFPLASICKSPPPQRQPARPPAGSMLV